MSRIRGLLSATSLVLFPLLILAYWLLYPAYGKLDPADVLRAIDGHASMTTLSDVFAFAGTFLSVPATLALMRVLADRSPRLAFIGGGMNLIGWIALVGALVGDVVAVQMVLGGSPTPAIVDLYRRIMLSPTMVALESLALLHVVGGTLLGIALWRTKIIPRWAGVAATITPPIHLVSNIAGVLWLDALTWIALAAALACVAPLVINGASVTKA